MCDWEISFFRKCAENVLRVNKAPDPQLDAQTGGDLLAVFDLLRRLVLVHNGQYHIGDVGGGFSGKVQKRLVGCLPLDGVAQGHIVGGVVVVQGDRQAINTPL